MRQSGYIALLRGINVGGHNKIPMQDLRALCEDLGWKRVASYIQSGNLVFESLSAKRRPEETLEAAIEDRFGLAIKVLIRTAKDWSEYLKANPFPHETENEPSRVMLMLSKQPPREGAVKGLMPYAQGGERIRQAGGALWVHYKNGAGKSKLTPSGLERFVGSPVTARNWRTVLKLEEMAHSL